jgi:hypothetical protein
MKKVILDTLAPNGKFELKRIASFTSFWVAVGFSAYGISVEVIFGFLGYSATSIGLNVWNKKIEK